MSHIEAVRKWLLTSKLFSSAEKFNVNYLGDSPTGFTVQDVTGDPILARYNDGSALRIKNYIIEGRMPYGSDRAANGRASAFFDALSEWIEAQEEKSAYPAIGRVQELTVSGSGGILYTDASSAVYQIQINITYL